jgi:hypothetical protein
MGFLENHQGFYVLVKTPWKPNISKSKFPAREGVIENSGIVIRIVRCISPRPWSDWNDLVIITKGNHRLPGADTPSRKRRKSCITKVNKCKYYFHLPIKPIMTCCCYSYCRGNISKPKGVAACGPHFLRHSNDEGVQLSQHPFYILGVRLNYTHSPPGS